MCDVRRMERRAGRDAVLYRLSRVQGERDEVYRYSRRVVGPTSVCTSEGDFEFWIFLTAA